jgi:hypothetical protein
MTEQKQQNNQSEIKKRPSLVSRIIGWMWIGLLSLLLAGLFFQAPWKATTLILIFLLAATILPRAYSKWFWVGIGVIVVGLIIWVFLPEYTEGWRPYTFDKELAVLEAQYAVPDRENAAIIYNQLLEDYNKAAFEPNFVDPNLGDLIREEPWSNRDHPEAAQWLGQHESTIAKLIEASKTEQCRFPINADIMSNSDTLDRLSAMRKWAHLLASAANNDIGDSRIDQAFEKQIAVLHMAKHQYQQPSLIDVLVGAGLEAFSTNQLKRLIVTGDATEERLNLIEQALFEIKHDWSCDWPRILDYEKLIHKNFCGMFYGVSPEGKIRLNPSAATRVIMAQLPEDMKDKFVITYWHKRLMKASTILCWFYMPSTPQKAGEIIDAEYEKFYAMANPNFDWQKGVENPTKMLRFNYRYLVEHLAGILEPTYYSIHDTYLRTVSQQRGALLTIALRRYKNKNGHWPGSLDDIQSLAQGETFVDPTNGGPFIYKLTNENFTLYSKGKNGIDDGGKRDKWGEEKTGADDIVIWPPAGTKRKAEKENTDAK